MKISDMLIGLLLFSALLIGITGFYGDVGGHYGIAGAADLSYMSAANKTMTLVNEMQSQTQSSSLGGVSILDVPFMIVNGAYNALKLSFSSLDIFTSLISDMTAATGLPIGWIVAIILAILTVVITFAIFRALFKTDI